MPLFALTSRRFRSIRQSESAECGLVCLLMIADYHGVGVDPVVARRQFQTTSRGLQLGDLLAIAKGLGLAARPVKLELEGLRSLRLPAILHWNFNHFVVLNRVTTRDAVIHDPASGRRTVGLQELSRSFTGVALELWRGDEFKLSERIDRPGLWRIVLSSKGIGGILARVGLVTVFLELVTVLLPLWPQLVLGRVGAGEDGDLVWLLALAFAAIVVMQSAVSIIRLMILSYVSYEINNKWKSSIMDLVFRLPLRLFDVRSSSDIISRFHSVDGMQKIFSAEMIECFIDFIFSIVILIIMFTYSARIALIASVFFVIYLAARLSFLPALRQAGENEIVARAQQETYLGELLRGVRPIRLLGMAAARQARWLNLQLDQNGARVTQARLDSIGRSIGSGILGIERVAGIAIGADLVTNGLLDLSAFISFLAFKEQLFWRLSRLLDHVTDVGVSNVHAQRVLEFFREDSAGGEAAAPPPRLFQDIGEASLEVRNLSFRYSDRDPWLFRDISFNVRDGEFFAIRGPSGVGKSSLLRILLGTHLPNTGEVLFSRRNIIDIGLEEYWQNIGVVLQDDQLFSGTIIENISLFEAAADIEWAEQCASWAQIYDDVSRMPMRMHTSVGEMGSALSGGQRQRILLARALYRRPKILFLDEATSQLDRECEERINLALKELSMTRIVIAHREETLRLADRTLALA